MHSQPFVVLCESGGKTRTKDKYRVVYTDKQRLELEKEFQYNHYITMRRKSELSAALALSERQVRQMTVMFTAFVVIFKMLSDAFLHFYSSDRTATGKRPFVVLPVWLSCVSRDARYASHWNTSCLIVNLFKQPHSNETTHMSVNG